MIYLENTPDTQLVAIPSNGLVREAFCTRLQLRSTISGEAVMTEDFEGLPADKGYFAVSVTLPQGLAVGEYAYILTEAAGQEIARGLCQIGQYSRPISQSEGGFTLKQAK